MLEAVVLAVIFFVFPGSAVLAAAASKPDAGTLPFKIPEFHDPAFPDRTFNIRDYGGVGDGRKINTKVFRRAVDECSLSGGGHVVVPPGTWLTGPIHLKSGVDLHLEKGSEIRFSTNLDDYLPVVFTRWEGTECYNYSPLIYANGCTNIAVTGEGKLNGQGEAWWTAMRNLKRPAAERLYGMACDDVPVKDRVFGDKMPGLRPSFLNPVKCRNVLIEGVSLTSGPMWTIHPVYCENVIVRKVKVKTNGPNNDGCDPDSCRNVLIEDCLFSTGDDCIVIKSGLNEDGWRVGRPTENVVIRRCRMEKGHGGVVIGSEMSGGVKNLYACDCVFDGSDTGIRLKSQRGRGGVVENAWFRNIRMKSIRKEAVQITTFYGAGTVQPRTETPPTFKGIHIENVTCDGCGRAAAVTGLPEKPLEDVSFGNVTITGVRGITCTDVKGLHLDHVTISNDTDPAITLVNTRDAGITNSKCAKPVDVFLHLSGERTSNVRLNTNDVSQAKRDVEVDPDVKGEVTREGL